jgi:hypothetical protein
MCDPTRDQSDWVAHEPAAADAGASVNPSELPEEDTAPDVAHPRAIPIGHPTSAEEYQHLKEAARTRIAPPAPSAQEDPAAPHTDQ